MMTVTALTTGIAVRLNELTNVTLALPMLVFYPTSRCNSRCLSCDWWRSSGEDDLTLDEIDALAASLPPLGTRLVVFSGGEPLLRRDVFEAARRFGARGAALHLLTSGIMLDRLAPEVAGHFSRVTISLDAADATRYLAIRGVAAFDTLRAGVAKLRAAAPELRVTARATLHRLNFRELPQLIAAARAMRLDGISFLAADLSSTAFGRTSAGHTPAALGLDVTEIAEFGRLIEQTIAEHGDDFESRFIAESPDRLRRLVHYYAAVERGGALPPSPCNAPWTSVVVEANGAVRPCFFHRPIGNIRRTPLATLVTRELPAFRRTLDMPTDPVCGRCVCSIKTGWRSAPWN